jgi:glutaredoxin-like YruB-family protein
MTKVVVYGTPTCPYCTYVKQFLTKYMVKFNYIDVSQDQKSAEYIVKKTKQMGVPVIEIDDQFVVGFDQTKLKQLLKLE